MAPTPLVVVGVDGSHAAAEALDLAAREARRRGARLEVVFAWGRQDPPFASWEIRLDPDEVQLWAQARVEEMAAQSPAGQDLPVVPVAVNDLPAPALLDAAARADLLVVGSRGEGGFLGLRLGSVCHKVLAHAPCPVMVVHEGSATSDDAGRIVVGVDGSEGSRVALLWAADEADRRGAPLLVVHGWSPPAVAGGTFPAPYPPVDVWERGARLLVDEEVERARAAFPTLDVEGRLVCAGGAGALLEAAADAALVVVGTRGRGWVAELLLGSVGQQVTRHAECPAVVVPDGSTTDG